MSADYETGLLQANCPKCAHLFFPFGQIPQVLPRHATLKCPECGHIWSDVWYDPRTQKELDLIREKSRAGFTESTDVKPLFNTIEELKNRVTFLEQSYAILKKELDVEGKKRELTESEMVSIKEWAKRREQDFKIIEEMAGEIEQDDKFRKDNR